VDAEKSEDTPETTPMISEADNVKESGKVVTAVSNALLTGDKAAFLGNMTSDVRAEASGGFDITGDGAKKLGKALGEAKVVDSSGPILFYECSVDGEKVSFYTTTEDGVWKLNMF
jgi:hypothetical protein